MPVLKLANSMAPKDAVVLDLGDLQRQGEVLVERARARAAHIVGQAEAERERLIADATAVGHAQGLAAGRAEGEAAGRAEGHAGALAEHGATLAAIEAAWTGALEVFVGQRERLLDDARREIVMLAALLASRVVKRSVELDPSVVVGQMEAVLGLVMRPSRVVLCVHPADRAVVERAMPGLVARFGTVTHAALEEDEGLSRGSCLARLQPAEGRGGSGLDGGGIGGEIDASIQTQLERLADALLPGVKIDLRAGASAGQPNGEPAAPQALSPGEGDPAGGGS
jgi:flagellar assembly protein FliH